MNKIMIAAAAALTLGAAASAQGKVEVTGVAAGDTIVVNHGTVAGSFERGGLTADTIIAKAGVPVTIALEEAPQNSFVAVRAGQKSARVYARPDETITIDLSGDNAAVSGSPLMASIEAAEAQTIPMINDFVAARQAQAPDSVLEAKYDALMNTFATLTEQNIGNDLGLYLLRNVQGDKMIELFGQVPQEVANGIFAPLYENIGNYVARKKAIEEAKKSVAVGMPAPDFSLPDRNGNMVSLSSLRGKTVILDFWGSWCGWCIKGIPQMKEQYARLKDKGLQIMGIACNDSHDAWIAALDKYELPWVNVWSDPEAPQQVSATYAVEGYPTKMVVNPEGIIVNITVGENPDFYKQFDELLK